MSESALIRELCRHAAEITRNQAAPFAWTELYHRLDKSLAFELETFDADPALIAELSEHELVFFYRRDELQVFSRSALFAEASFLVRPTAFELRHGVFFPGHRLLPFLSESVSARAALYRPGGRRKLPECGFAAAVDDLALYHSLLSEEADGDFELEVADGEMLSETSFSAVAAAVDLSGFYRECHFQEGDFIRITIRDARKGRCEIEHYGLDLMRCDPGRITRWNEAFEKALGKAVSAQKEMGGLFVNQDLLAAAMALGGAPLYGHAVSCWMEAIKNSRRFRIQPGLSDDKALIWSVKGLREYLAEAIQERVEAEMADVDEDFDFFDESVIGQDETLEKLFRIMGFDLDTVTVTGYMLDALHCGGDLDAVKTRCFDDRLAEFPDLIPALDRELDLLWRKASRTSPSLRTLPMVKIRHDLLELKDRQLAFIRELADNPGFSPADLMGADFRPYQELCSMLDEMLVLLIEEPVGSSRELQNLSASVAAARNVFDRMEAELRSRYL